MALAKFDSGRGKHCIGETQRLDEKFIDDGDEMGVFKEVVDFLVVAGGQELALGLLDRHL